MEEEIEETLRIVLIEPIELAEKRLLSIWERSANNLSNTHPLRLELALTISRFYAQNLDNIEKAQEFARTVYNESEFFFSLN